MNEESMRDELLDRAARASAHSHAPASGFRVGAALQAAGGIYSGCNIENESLGLSVCAERVAIFKAVSEGEREFTEIAVISATGEDAPPCGACRQVLAELAPGIRVTYRIGGKTVTRTIEELVPDAFRRGSGG